MHRDYKERRAAIKQMQSRELRQEKVVNEKALGKLKSKSYQQKYAEMMERREQG